MNQTTQTVENLASRVITLERTSQPAECRSAAFQRHFTAAARNPFIGWNPGPQTILNFQVSDVVLDGEFRGLLNVDGFLSGTGYLLPDEFLMGLRVDAGLLVPLQRAGTIIIGCNLAHTNYFHWCSQAWVRGREAHSRNFANISIVYDGQILGVCLSRGGCRRRLFDREDLLRH